MKEKLQHFLHRWYGLVALFVVGGMIGWLLPITSPFSMNELVKNRGAVLYQSSDDYKFIDPLLACDIGTEAEFPELAPVKSTVNKVVQAEISQGNAQSISVYLRSLKGARWFEINGQTQYAPASLLKVFVMMAYYKEDNDLGNNSVLSRQISFRGSASSKGDTPGQIIPHLVNGGVYSVDQVIKQMVVYSDNDALNTLVDNFDKETYQDFQAIFSDLKIPSPVTQSEDAMNFMSVENYAMAFRVLFGSTYLSREYSERALGLLSQAKYTDGIVAGIPTGLTVAHKFGVRSIPAAQNGGAEGAELHDCGIVYYPDHPYLLCVMTRGSNFGELQNVLQNVSSTAYKSLDTFYKDPNNFKSTTVSGVALPK
jgi:beta-lactamase class A